MAAIWRLPVLFVCENNQFATEVPFAYASANPSVAARGSVYGLPGVEVDVFDGLLVDYARKRGAGVILRGIRAISDYEYELQMALMNRKLEPRLETVFMLPGEPYSYLSAKLVREIAQFGGPLDGLVPAVVEERLRAKIS